MIPARRRFAFWSLIALFSFAACATWAAGQTVLAAKSGLVVNQPKVYDNYYLQQQLQGLKSQLEAVQLLSGTSLSSRIGNVQGGTLNQLGVALQAGGLPTPSTKSIAGATPSSETDTNSTSAPAPSVSATGLALPTPSVGSTDALREIVQLQAQITALQLLLDGALSDKIEADGWIRRVLTLGFPISVRAPDQSDYRERNKSVALIEVSLCHVPNGADDHLALVTLLPRERTYDVAGLSEHSFSASAGAILGGVVSVGGGFLRKKQTYYVLQEQETVAFQNAQASCPGQQVGTSFSWAIRPVLGSTQVRPGMQDDFVQFAINNAAQGTSSVTACVSVEWVHQRKDNAVLDKPSGSEAPSCFEVPNLYEAPVLTAVHVHNTVGGNLLVQALGQFLPGFQVRAGQTVLPASAVQVDPSGHMMEIQIAAADLLRGGGLTLVGRNNESKMLELKSPDSLHKMAKVKYQLTPYSDTLTRVTLDFAQPYDADAAGQFKERPPGSPFEDPWIVMLDGTIYGLKDAPFLVNTLSQSVPASRHLEFVVPTSSLANAPPMELRRLLWPADASVQVLDRTEFAVISKSIEISNANGLKLMLLGNHLDQLHVVYPPECAPEKCLSAVTANSAILTLEAATVKAVKQMVFCQTKAAVCDPDVLPVLLDVTASAAPEVKPSLIATSVSEGSTSVAIPGTAAKSVIGVKYADKAIPIHLGNGKLVLDLSGSSLPQSGSGSYPLVVTYADGTTSIYALTIR